MFGTIFGVLLISAAGLADSHRGNKQLDFSIIPSLPDGVVNSKNIVCRDQSRLYFNHLKNLSLWAYEMRDATAKSVTGLLRGGIFQFGSFDECLSVNAPFKTQYCLTTITADVPPPKHYRDPKSLFYDPNELLLRKIYDKHDPSQQPENVAILGWCVPASCSPRELQEHLNEYLSEVDLITTKYNLTYKSHLEDKSCQKQNEFRQFDQLDITFCLVSLIIACLVIFSTIFGVICKKRGLNKLMGSSPIIKFANSFSLIENFTKLPRVDNADPELQILFGTRVFCILMIIMDHRFGTTLASGVLNFNIVEEQYRSAFGSLFFHGDLFVDSFFILSGLLVAYFMLIQYEKKFVNPCLIVLIRYIRLTPVYAFVIFYYATLFNYSGNGPMWKTIISPEVQDCRKNWWLNLLYVSNYINADHMCMVHSWYLPCDFHYFIIGLVICFAIYKTPRIGLAFLGIISLMSVLIPFFIVYIHERPGVLYFYPEFLRSPKTHADFLLSYTKSHTRAAPYFLGMIAGYIYYKMRNTEKHLKKVYSHVIFGVSVLLILGSIFTGIVFYDPYYEYDAVGSAAYLSLHRAAWSVGSIGILYVTSYGHAKFLYNILAWKPWIPLSKLVYGAYLIHMQFQLRAVAAKVSAEKASYFNIISSSLSDIVLAFGSSFVLYLTVEAPFRNIFSMLLMPHKEKNLSAKSHETVSETTCDSHL